MEHETVTLTHEAITALAVQIADRLVTASSRQVWLTPDETAKRLRLTRRGLEDMRKRGGGPAFYKANRVVRYRAADVDSWLLQNDGGARG